MDVVANFSSGFLLGSEFLLSTSQLSTTSVPKVVEYEFVIREKHLGNHKVFGRLSCSFLSVRNSGHLNMSRPSLNSSSSLGLGCRICASGNSCREVNSRTKQMRFLIERRKPHEVLTTFESLVKDGHKPSLISYTTLLTALTTLKLYALLPSVISEVEEYGMKPDVVFYNVVINSFSEAGHVEFAMVMFWKMKKSGFIPTTNSYNTLIKGYGIVGKPEECLKIMELMSRESDTCPDQRTYNILIRAWCNKPNLEEAWNALHKMKESEMQPDIVTYNTIARAYALNGETKRAKDLILEMQKLKLQPNERTCGIIITGYCKEQNMAEALAFMHHMKDFGVRPNLVVFNSLLKGCFDVEDKIAVRKVLDLMEGFGVTPDVVTYSIQMDAWSEAGSMDKCREVFDNMVEAGIEPDDQVYSILAKGYVHARQPDKAEALLTTMEEFSMCPSVVIFTTIISGWCSAGNMENAMRIYSKMCDSGVPPNLKTFETLIWGYGEAKEPKKAEELLEAMKKLGISPKKNIIHLVAAAWRAVGLHDEAVRVLGNLGYHAEQPLSSDLRDKIPSAFSVGLQQGSNRSSLCDTATPVTNIVNCGPEHFSTMNAKLGKPGACARNSRRLIVADISTFNSRASRLRNKSFLHVYQKRPFSGIKIHGQTMSPCMI